MASMKPRGRPRADGNYIVWSDELVETLLRLRFVTYAEPMKAARGTKSLQQAWRDVAEKITQQNNGGVVSIVQCRNKVKALRTKWLAYHAGVAPKPEGLALMDEFWGFTEKKEETLSCSSLEPVRRSKKPKLNPISTLADDKSRVFVVPGPVSSPKPSSASDSTPTLTTAVESKTSIINPSQGLPVETTQESSDIAEAANLKASCSVRNPDLSKLEKLINDRFGKVLERQEKQLNLTVVQNQLLAQLLGTVESLQQ